MFFLHGYFGHNGNIRSQLGVKLITAQFFSYDVFFPSTTLIIYKSIKHWCQQAQAKNVSSGTSDHQYQYESPISFMAIGCY